MVRKAARSNPVSPGDLWGNDDSSFLITLTSPLSTGPIQELYSTSGDPYFMDRRLCEKVSI